jgi:hypothetical protein
VLVAAAHLDSLGPAPVVAGRTGAVVSILSWAPVSWLQSKGLVWGLRCVFAAGALAWVCRVLPRWVSWITTAAFVLLAALHQESREFAAHSAHLPAQILVLFSLCELDLARSERQRAAPSSLSMPPWFWTAGALLVGWFYTLAGVSKLRDGGFAWADGLTMQLYAWQFGLPDSWLRRLVVEHRGVAQVLQILTLVFESGAVLMAPWRPTRWLAGAMLLGFHVGQGLLFGYPFHANMLLVTVFLLPWREALARRSAPASAPAAGAE